MLNRKQTLTTLLISLSLGLTLFSSASNSRSSRHYEKPGNPNNYNVELVGSLGRSETELSTVVTDFSAVSAEIYFEDIDIRNKPLAYAGFLSKQTSLSLFYVKAETDVETFGSVSTSEDASKGIQLNYISPVDNYILGFTYSSGDISNSAGTNLAESDSAGINIGKYIDDQSIIEFSYLESTTKSISSIFTASVEITSDIATLSYETLINQGGERFIYLSASASQIKQDLLSFDTTSQAYSLTGEVVLNKTTSISATVGLVRGDELTQEGNFLSAGGTHFLTTEFAINVAGSLYIPDDEFSEETMDISISGIVRF